MENDVEETYHEEPASLFAGDDFRYMFKMREVLRHIRMLLTELLTLPTSLEISLLRIGSRFAGED